LDELYLNWIKRLIDRLEHLSADSIYAHRASGLRGSLLRYMERIEAGERMNRDDQAQMDRLMEYGFKILERAAKEIGASK
jgi:hypothetical protein